MTEAVFDLHGTRLAISAPPEMEPAARAIRARLAALPRVSGPAELRFELALAPPAAIDGGRQVYELPDGGAWYDDAGGRLHARYGSQLELRCEPGRGRARATAAVLDGDQAWALSHPLFTLALVELLKHRGLYSLHAGGVCDRGRALLLAGGSGCGKSTLTLAAARAGLPFLGDDTLFLARSGGSVSVLGFPDEVDLADGALGMFPELSPMAAAPAQPGWRKRQVRPEIVYGTPLARQASPAVLVLPRIAGGAASRVTPLTAGEALLELIPNVLPTDADSTQSHLAALADLTAASACYRMETGHDLDHAVATLRRLLAETGASA